MNTKKDIGICEAFLKLSFHYLWTGVPRNTLWEMLLLATLIFLKGTLSCLLPKTFSSHSAIRGIDQYSWVLGPDLAR